MKAPTHVAAAVDCWLGGCLAVHASPAALVIGAAAAGVVAPWPDVDNYATWMRRRPGWLIDWRAYPVKSRVSWLVTRGGKHRENWTHSLAGAAIMGVAALLPWFALAWWPWWAGIAVFTGWASHPLLDMLNRDPVRLWWPGERLVHGLPRRFRIRVGTAPEAGVAAVLGIVPLFLLWAWLSAFAPS